MGKGCESETTRAQRQHKTLQQGKQFEQQNEDKRERERTEGTLTKRGRIRVETVFFLSFANSEDT